MVRIVGYGLYPQMDLYCGLLCSCPCQKALLWQAWCLVSGNRRPLWGWLPSHGLCCEEVLSLWISSIKGRGLWLMHALCASQWKKQWITSFKLTCLGLSFLTMTGKDWKSSFSLAIWFIWKETLLPWWEIILHRSLDWKHQIPLASWVAILSAFCGISIDLMLLNWMEVAYSSVTYGCPLFSLLGWFCLVAFCPCSWLVGVFHWHCFFVLLLLAVLAWLCLCACLSVYTFCAAKLFLLWKFHIKK